MTIFPHDLGRIVIPQYKWMRASLVQPPTFQVAQVGNWSCAPLSKAVTEPRSNVNERDRLPKNIYLKRMLGPLALSLRVIGDE